MSNFVDDGSNYDKRGFSMAATCSPTCLPVSPDYRILKSFRPRAFKRLVENSLRVSTSAAHGKIILLSPLPPPLFPRVITLNLNLSPAFVRENYGPFSPNANEPPPPPPNHLERGRLPKNDVYLPRLHSHGNRIFPLSLSSPLLFLDEIPPARKNRSIFTTDGNWITWEEMHTRANLV